jgi:hypothetical protein
VKILMQTTIQGGILCCTLVFLVQNTPHFILERVKKFDARYMEMKLGIIMGPKLQNKNKGCGKQGS